MRCSNRLFFSMTCRERSESRADAPLSNCLKSSSSARAPLSPSIASRLSDSALLTSRSDWSTDADSSSLPSCLSAALRDHPDARARHSSAEPSAETSTIEESWAGADVMDPERVPSSSPSSPSPTVERRGWGVPDSPMRRSNASRISPCASSCLRSLDVSSTALTSSSSSHMSSSCSRRCFTNAVVSSTHACATLDVWQLASS
mmetsp:Transcript_27010/g.54325  ORF Transcript_27010/g.54325 Transcript_27010/m.54325 type:complete len:203 (+) Transcript_27010:831-1439(+)